MAWPKGKPRREVAGADEAPVSVPEAAVAEREPTVAELREYDRRVNRDLSSQYERTAAKVRAVLAEEYGADMADRIMADIAGVLKDPTRERNRRRLRPVA
jgi:hypothetical protein